MNAQTKSFQKLRTDELKLGDIVQVFDDAYGTATVKNITDNEVHFFRPYGANVDFSSTGGLICYVGIEEFSRPISDKSTWLVYRRQTLR